MSCTNQLDEIDFCWFFCGVQVQDFFFSLVKGIKPRRKTLLWLTREHAALYFCWRRKSTSSQKLLCPHIQRNVCPLNWWQRWFPSVCHFCMNYILNVCLKRVVLSILTFPYRDVIVITDLPTFVSVYDTA